MNYPKARMTDYSIGKAFLIDDSEIDLFIHKRFLEVCKFSEELVLYQSADEALKYLQSVFSDDAPEVIFLDLNMPDSDGFSFLNCLMKLPSSILDKTKVVVLSSSESALDRDRAFSFRNVIHFIPKPIRQSDIEDLKKVFTRKS